MSDLYNLIILPEAQQDIRNVEGISGRRHKKGTKGRL